MALLSQNNELKIQYGFTTKALLLLAHVPNVQIVQYVQVDERNPYGSDGLNVLNGLNYLNRLRAAFNVPSVVKSLLPFACGFAAARDLGLIIFHHSTTKNVKCHILIRRPRNTTPLRSPSGRRLAPCI